MTDRVYQGTDYLDFSRYGRSVEFDIMPDNYVKVSVSDDVGNSFLLTAEQATLLKEFLISKGY